MNKIIYNNNAKARSKPGQIFLIFFFANVRQAESQNHNNEIDNFLQNFMINCHNDLN